MKKKPFNLRYTIGEIIIVSIGILIAFGINTCSGNLKSKKVYKEYRASLIADLENNISNLDKIILAQKEKVVELDKALTLIESNNFDRKEISNILFKQRKSPTFFPVNGTFKSMVAQGEIELFNTNLKRELFNLYDTNYERTVYNGNMYDNIYVNVYDEEIRNILDIRNITIDNVERLQSKDFLKNIMLIIDEATSYIKLIKKSKKESEHLLNEIKKSI